MNLVLIMLSYGTLLTGENVSNVLACEGICGAIGFLFAYQNFKSFTFFLERRQVEKTMFFIAINFLNFHLPKLCSNFLAKNFVSGKYYYCLDFSTHWSCLLKLRYFTGMMSHGKPTLD